MDIIQGTSGKVKHSLHEVLPYINRESWRDTVRFYKVIRRSGAKGPIVWAAILRWTANRPGYASIHHGLKEYFEAEIRGTVYGKGA